MAQTAASGIGVFALGLFMVMGMGATLAWAQRGDLPPPSYSPPPDGVPTSPPPTYPPTRSLAPPPPPQREDTLDACLSSNPKLSIGARLAKLVPKDYQFDSSATNITLFMPTDEAFNVFATSLGINLTENFTDIVNIPYTSTLLQAFRYHMIPYQWDLQILVSAANISRSGFVTTWDYTDLGRSLFAVLNVAAYKNTGDEAANITVYGTSSSAKVLQYDIRCGNSSLNIIDTVLQYWYADLDAALTAYSVTTLRDGLQKTDLMPVLLKGNGTIFAPSDGAFTSAQGSYGYDFTTSVDTLKYHVVPSPVMILQTKEQRDDYTTLNPKPLRVTTFGNSSPPVVSTWITGGVRASISLPAIPVGVAPTFYIYIINQVLIPTYTNLLQAVNNENFTYLQTMVATDREVSSMLATSSNMTLFAPTDQAIRAYVTKEYGSQSEVTPGVFKDRLKDTLQNHVIGRAYSFQALFNLSNTARGAVINAVKGKLWFSPPQVTVKTEYTSAEVISPNNISVLYGRSYMHAINYVLSPYPHGNGSGSAAPSLLVLGLSLLVARLIAAQL